MSLLRLNDFLSGTVIQDSQVDAEFDQLVQALNGVKDVDILHKFTHATSPVLNINQLGAGLIMRGQQNSIDKFLLNNDGSLNIGTPGGSPTNGRVGGPDSSGTNIAGAHIDLHGGKATGNAIPGYLAARFPLITGTGTTLQSLSTDRFPVSVNMFTNVNFASSIANTTTETSLISSHTGSAGSTRVIEAGSSRAGTVYRVRIEGIYGATAGPTGRYRIKLGSTLITDSTASVVPNVGTGLFILEFLLVTYSIGSSATVGAIAVRGEFVPGLSGVVAPTFIYAGTFTTVDLTANQTIDVTWEWGTANALNTITSRTCVITRERN